MRGIVHDARFGAVPVAAEQRGGLSAQVRVGVSHWRRLLPAALLLGPATTRRARWWLALPVYYAPPVPVVYSAPTVGDAGPAMPRAPTTGPGIRTAAATTAGPTRTLLVDKRQKRSPNRDLVGAFFSGISRFAARPGPQHYGSAGRLRCTRQAGGVGAGGAQHGPAATAAAATRPVLGPTAA
ncbi:MAG: hypothetical protein WKG07_27850 [Hymenobacter sp.]